MTDQDPATYAKGFLTYSAGDAADMERKLDGIAGAYFGVAGYKKQVDDQVNALAGEIERHRASLYSKYRDMKAEQKLTEAAIEAMIKVDPMLAEKYKRLALLETGARLLKDLMDALSMRSTNLRTLINGAQAERQIAARS